VSRAVVLSVGALLVLLAGGIAYLLPSQETHAPAQPSPSGINQWQAFITEHFAFDEACKDCHVEQFAAHQRSGHSRTATPMRETNVADKLDGTEYRDQRRDQSFTFKRSSDSFLVQATEENPFPVHWLLGSGVHARTPVSIDPVSGHGVEFRWSWFAHLDGIGVTPDHQRFDDYKPHSLECYGRPLDPKQALACVNCHMTAVPPDGVSPTQDMFYPNVSCERCHGPRKEHVRLAKLGQAEEAKPLLQYNDQTTYMRQCAQCHRDETNIPPNSEQSALARYQPYGLQKSKCFQSSKNMTCSTCHDPHDSTSSDRRMYNDTCLQCHQAPEQTPCALQPAGDCVTCHMPAVEWEAGIEFHDHWIRVVDSSDREQP